MEGTGTSSRRGSQDVRFHFSARAMLDCGCVMTAVGTLVALSLPSLFLAVTTTRSVLLPSAPWRAGTAEAKETGPWCLLG
jgi:hypothetical protein